MKLSEEQKEAIRIGIIKALFEGALIVAVIVLVVILYIGTTTIFGVRWK